MVHFLHTKWKKSPFSHFFFWRKSPFFPLPRIYPAKNQCGYKKKQGRNKKFRRGEDLKWFWPKYQLFRDLHSWKQRVWKRHLASLKIFYDIRYINNHVITPSRVEISTGCWLKLARFSIFRPGRNINQAKFCSVCVISVTKMAQFMWNMGCLITKIAKFSLGAYIHCSQLLFSATSPPFCGIDKSWID